MILLTNFIQKKPVGVKVRPNRYKHATSNRTFTKITDTDFTRLHVPRATGRASEPLPQLQK
jgi:hypothetical protein